MTTRTRQENPRRTADLVRILKAARIRNEAGELMEDFTMQNRDALDFGSVCRSTIEDMLEAAYIAGATAARAAAASRGSK